MPVFSVIETIQKKKHKSSKAFGIYKYILYTFHFFYAQEEIIINTLKE